MSRSEQQFAAALTRIEQELDWVALGTLYCEEGGEDFFSSPQRDAMRDAGLLIAADVSEALDGSAAAHGRSLYVGAAVGELVVLLCESIVLQREVVVVNLPGPETDELNRVFGLVERETGTHLPRIRADAWSPQDVGPCDHVWLASVLTDPDHFPALHDELYERNGTPLATQRGHLPSELAAARALVKQALECASPGSLISTTDEELPIVREQCERRGWTLAEPESARLSAVVGDPLRVCRVEVSERRGT